jgi:hypothetical protein
MTYQQHLSAQNIADVVETINKWTVMILADNPTVAPLEVAVGLESVAAQLRLIEANKTLREPSDRPDG